MILKGTSINIRDWEAKDLMTFKYWNTGHHPWMDFNGPYYSKPTTTEIAAKIAAYQTQIEKGNWPEPRERIVIADKENNQLLGTVNWYWQSRETNWKSIGIAIYDDTYWSKGIGFQALELWIDYLFQQDEQLVRLDFRTWSGNPGMMNLGRKLEFQEEARFRQARIVNGVYYDSIGMGILRTEWYSRLNRK